MNYGYAGTKELNEALVSRFLVIQMPDQNEETLEKIFTTSFPEENRKPSNSLSDFFWICKKRQRTEKYPQKLWIFEESLPLYGQSDRAEAVSCRADGCDQQVF